MDVRLTLQSIQEVIQSIHEIFCLRNEEENLNKTFQIIFQNLFGPKMKLLPNSHRPLKVPLCIGFNWNIEAATPKSPILKIRWSSVLREGNLTSGLIFLSD